MGKAIRCDWTRRSRDWARWADGDNQVAKRLNTSLLDAADIWPGQAVLDLASGVGEPSISIARHLGNDGIIVATDIVPAMLNVVRKRAKIATLTSSNYCAADMAALPFPTSSFDRVVCRLGIMFLPDVDIALREAIRVLKPGGRAVYLVWGNAPENTALSVIHNEIGQYLTKIEDIEALDHQLAY